MSLHRAWAAVVLWVVVFPPFPVLARTWYIRSDGNGDAPTVQAGIDSAAAGDDVLVATGTYTWTSQGMGTSLYGPTMIEVREGIRLHSESGALVTNLDAEQQGRVLVCKFCTGIEGFAITGGRTLRDPYGGYAGMGGGIFVLGGQPLLADNILWSNFAGGAGGAIGTHGGRTPGTAPVIRGNTVLWNVAGYRTGGIEVGGSEGALVENNTLVGNAGGGIACMNCGGTIARNIIAKSTVSSDGLVDGFGMFCVTFDGAPPDVECNILWENSGGDAVCGTDGGGNIIEDPGFCASDPSNAGLRFVRPDSPALPQNNSCGALIGATGEGCAGTGASDPSQSLMTLTVAPNPPASKATIRYSLAPGAGSARLTVYDLAGRLVARILEGAVGDGAITWDGRDTDGVRVSAGVYIVRLESDESTVAQKLVWVR